MKTPHWILFGVLVFSWSVSASAWAENDAVVKVRLKSRLSSVKVSGFQIKMPYDGAGPRLEFQKRRIELRRILKDQRIVWEISDSQLPQKMYWQDEVLMVQGETMSLGLEPAPKTLLLYPLDTKAFDVVASLNVENYLAGVLPSEMPASWPMEALKAQVVASRSYMLALMKERRHQHFQLESSVFDQVYKHVNRVGISQDIQKRILSAIRETRGDVLVGARGEIFKSFYHADCGGQTEEPKYVWGMEKKNGTVKDGFCPSSPHAKWEYRLSKSRLKSELAKHLPIESSSEVRGMLIAQRTPSGRVAELEVLKEDSTSFRISAQDFRRAIGFHRIKSTNFRLFWFGEEVVIEGRGHGHGVGMCQWGARSLAKRGVSYRDILKRYYPRSRLISEASKKDPKKLTAQLDLPHDSHEDSNRKEDHRRDGNNVEGI